MRLTTTPPVRQSGPLSPVLPASRLFHHRVPYRMGIGLLLHHRRRRREAYLGPESGRGTFSVYRPTLAASSPAFAPFVEVVLFRPRVWRCCDRRFRHSGGHRHLWDSV